METSQSLANLAPALVKARLGFSPVTRDTDNSFFNSKYASLGSVMASALPALLQQGLTVMQSGGAADEAGIEILTRIQHLSGEWIQGRVWMPLVGPALKGGGIGPINSQSCGSALTYGRRYGLAALLGIVADEDDDGEAASSGARSAPASKSGGKSAPPPAEGDLVCPKCNGPVWDNRPKKASGEFKPNSPDAKCKDAKGCAYVWWKIGGEDEASKPTKSRSAKAAENDAPPSDEPIGFDENGDPIW